MKKLLFVSGFLLLMSCQQKQQQIDRLGVVTDSLAMVAAEKDSAILEFLSGFNEIQENLDSIKQVEKLVTIATSGQGELRGNQKQQIMEDISLLNQLLQKNKELTASLQNKLNNANSKVGQLQGMVTEFERMISNLNQQIEVKDTEIAQLSRDIERLNIDISQLTGQVEEVTREVQEKEEVIETQTAELNKAWYAMGTVKELEDNMVLEKSGGVLGMGRTLKIRKDFNRDYFSEVDIRTFTLLPLQVKKARVLSVHPPESWHITGIKTADTLFIDNSGDFWKASKYLLVVLD